MPMLLTFLFHETYFFYLKLILNLGIQISLKFLSKYSTFGFLVSWFVLIVQRFYLRPFGNISKWKTLFPFAHRFVFFFSWSYSWSWRTRENSQTLFLIFLDNVLPFFIYICSICSVIIQFSLDSLVLSSHLR